jgi:glutamine amidotransferase
MFGLVAARPVSLRQLLRDAPRSLRELSQQHPDGWGLAMQAQTDAAWQVQRGTACAARCREFEELAERVEARLVVAHIRQRTVGPTAISNTHPFQRGAFVFAHNGTLTNVGALVARTSPARSAEIVGDTDSERLFAFVLTRIDEAGEIEAGVRAAVRELHATAELGSASFLLSCGRALYAHRLGRPLCALIRHGESEPRRAAAVVVASEALTAESWHELPERSLSFVGGPAPTIHQLIS